MGIVHKQLLGYATGQQYSDTTEKMLSCRTVNRRAPTIVLAIEIRSDWSTLEWKNRPPQACFSCPASSSSSSARHWSRAGSAKQIWRRAPESPRRSFVPRLTFLLRSFLLTTPLSNFPATAAQIHLQAHHHPTCPFAAGVSSSGFAAFKNLPTNASHLFPPISSRALRCKTSFCAACRSMTFGGA